MRKSLHRLTFACRYAYKNFIHNPIRSFLLAFGFIGIFTTILIVVTMQNFFETYYVSQLEEKYQSFDLIVDLSSSGDKRFFSISQMKLDDQLNQMIDDYSMFFEFDVLLETNQLEKTYVHAFSSSIEEFSKVSNLSTSHEFINGNEMIVTKSFAKTYELEIADEVNLFAKDTTKSFVIIDIIDDGKLFIEQSIFIDKEESLSFFLSSLSPSLATLPKALLVNMYNTLYVNINQDYTYDQVVDAFKEITSYEDLEYTKTIDMQTVNHFVSRTTSVFSMMLSIVLVAILFVLQTTLLVYFNEKKLVFSQINILGGRKRFSFGLVSIELIGYFIISFLLSILITQWIIVYGIGYLEIELVYHLKISEIGFSLLVAILLFIVIISYYFRTFYKVSDMTQTKEQGIEVKFNLVKNIVLLMATLLGYLLLEFEVINQIFGIYAVLIQMMAALIFIFIFPVFILKGILYLLDKKKEKNLLYYHFSMLTSKKAFKHYTSIILIAFLTIMLLVFANGYMRQRPKNYQNDYELDFIVTHIVKDFNQVYDEISQLEYVDDAQRVAVFDEIYLNDYQDTIKQLVSIDYKDIETYFNINLENTLQDDFNDLSTYKILLPDRYQKIYDLKIGDLVHIDVNPRYMDQNFYISGFFEKELGDLAFTNMHQMILEDSFYNAIFVNGEENKDLLKDILFDLYSDKMIAVIDVDQQMSSLLINMEKTTVYITYILSLIILCFIIAMINHKEILFNDLKPNYAKLFVMGYAKKKMIMTLVLEGLIIFLIYDLSAAIGYAAIASKLADFGLLFGEYEPFKYQIHPMFSGSYIVFIVFVLQYMIFIYQVLKIKASEIIKAY